MNTGKAPICVPTWRGHIETTKDALIIFEACFTGQLAHCFRRPHDRERNELIVSGNVFVYEEATSGIKRWTDGVPWSPSRILTNFLIYRQLNNPFPPGEKKRATKRGQRAPRLGEPYPTPTRAIDAYTSPTKSTRAEDSYRFSPVSPVTPGMKGDEGEMPKDPDRCLLGSLVDSYEFKENGLLKKTMTVVINNVQHHLVSYYSLEDAKYNLETPRDDPRLRDIPLRQELLNQPKFKFTNYDDAGDGSYEQTDQSAGPYGYYAPSGFDPNRPQSAVTQGHASSPVFYSAMAQYPTPSHNPTSQAGYHASLPATQSGYIPIPSTPTASYHQQHNQHQPPNSAQHHGQHSTHHQSPSATHQHPPSSHHPAGHQAHSNYQHGAPYPSQPTQTLTYNEQPAHQISFHSTPHSNALPRPIVGTFVDYGGSIAPDAFSASSDYYGPSATSVTTGNDTTCLLPQPWQLSYQPPAYAHRSG